MINCFKHPDREAAGMCVSCGKPFCEECLSEVDGKNYCKTCLVETVETLRTQPTVPAVYKKKNTAILLWLFLGGIGAHRMYTEKTWSGIAMLLLWIINVAVASSCTKLGAFDIDTYLSFLSDNPVAWIALLAHGIWYLADIVTISSNLFTDRRGNYLL